MKLTEFLFLTLFTCITAGCSGERTDQLSGDPSDGHKSVSRDVHEDRPDEIVLSQETLEEFGIIVKEAGPGEIKMHVDLAGEIQAGPSGISHIIPRYNGIVREVYKTVGDRVAGGEKLALIESNESLSQYEVQSLIAGTIIEMHMTQGELIGNQEHAFTIADLSRVWASFHIYQKDLDRIKAGQRVVISAGSMDIRESGTISFVSPVVDEKTRTASARVVIDNHSGKWMPGMFVSAKAYVSEKQYPVVVEKSALQSLEGNTVVFVQGESGRFIPRAVSTGSENDVNIEITAGLQAGGRYVSKNSFVLKAEILKETFGGGHGH